MKQEMHTIVFKGAELEVLGSYDKGFAGSYEDPPEPRRFEIDVIYIGNVDVTEMLENDMVEIEVKVIEDIYNL